MKNQTLILIIIFLLIPGGFLAFFFLKKNKKIDKVKTKSVFPLKYGSKGKEVEKLQIKLSQLSLESEPEIKPFPLFGIDGIYGQETLSYIKKYNFPTEISETFYYKYVS